MAVGLAVGLCPGLAVRNHFVGWRSSGLPGGGSVAILWAGGRVVLGSKMMLATLDSKGDALMGRSVLQATTKQCKEAAFT